MPPPDKTRTLFEELALWTEQGIVSVFRGGNVDAEKSYIFLDFSAVPTADLIKRSELIKSKQAGEVPAWYVVVPAMHEEQRREWEDAYWITVCDGAGATPQEIAARFGAE